ncbi:MAG TPA: cupin domain-containing protein [Alphaproteobacteria bacterium]|nr:cupin domain-containing protein [Alphaproteobacteria bacterium]
MGNAAPLIRHLWLLDTRVDIRISCEDGTDRISVMEHLGPCGASPPLHRHRGEDEVFHVLEGELRFLVGGSEVRAGAGRTLIAPKGTPHTYRVESAAGARWLTVTAGEDFERFVRAFARPAERDGLPDPSGPPTAEEAEALAAACRWHGIEIVGPPLA